MDADNSLVGFFFFFLWGVLVLCFATPLPTSALSPISSGLLALLGGVQGQLLDHTLRIPAELLLGKGWHRQEEKLLLRYGKIKESSSSSVRSSRVALALLG